MKYINKRVLLIVAATITVLIGFWVAVSYTFEAPKISSSTPQNGSTDVDIRVPQITLHLNYAQPKIQASDITSVPLIKGGWKITNAGKTATISPALALDPLANYTIRVILHNRVGQTSAQTLTFTTQYVDSASLPSSLVQDYAIKTDVCEEAPATPGCPPLINLQLPYTDPDNKFMITYAEEPNHYLVTLIGNTDEEKSVAKHAALTWIANQGDKPNSLNLDYLYLAPSSDE